MTPEERAKQVCAELKGSPYDPEEWIEAQSPDVLEAVTSAIRAAENDALEQAALWHDEKAKHFKASAVESVTPPLYLTDVSNAQDQMSDTHKECAAAIRALKHKV